MADSPATPSSHAATPQPSVVAEIIRWQEAIQQTMMALQAGSTRREVERRGILSKLLDYLVIMARLLRRRRS